MLSTGHQIFQLSGAMCILLAYVGHQLKWMNPRGALYNILNAIGSGVLGYYAVWPRFQAGFVVLEFAWVAISLYSLVRNRQQLRTAEMPADD
jgi:hypothetical protein